MRIEKDMKEMRSEWNLYFIQNAMGICIGFT